MCGDNKNLNAYTVVEIRVTKNMGLNWKSSSDCEIELDRITLWPSGKRLQFAIEAMAVESSLIYPAKKVIFQVMWTFTRGKSSSNPPIWKGWFVTGGYRTLVMKGVKYPSRSSINYWVYARYIHSYNGGVSKATNISTNNTFVGAPSWQQVVHPKQVDCNLSS